ncbi:hypothetical protein [Chenggangzhangella methanolivorans]|uniref:Alpha/beta hydrolase n=1 Tax=Chenggangzhangella methanolivorans TaxID=1437009 RepID=A0A9E6R9W2_9HYPH|nr:hypothetical protein K6K41_04110 [Chenggangzhangella methanolivorans]
MTIAPERADRAKLSWPLMDTAARRALSVGLMEGLSANLDWFPRYQVYLRDERPPALIVWGPRDGYMPEAAALIREFLGRMHPPLSRT